LRRNDDASLRSYIIKQTLCKLTFRTAAAGPGREAAAARRPASGGVQRRPAVARGQRRAIGAGGQRGPVGGAREPVRRNPAAVTRR